MKRRRDLESYLQSVFKFLQHSLPQNLAEFLCLTKYDQHFVLRQLASQQYELMTSETLKEDSTLTPLELFAISRRLKTPVIWVVKFPNEENLFLRVENFNVKEENIKKVAWIQTHHLHFQ